MLKLIAVFFAICSITFATPTKEIVTVDNPHFQNYKGRMGKWVQPYTLMTSLDFFMKKVGATESDIKKINDIPTNQKIPLKDVIFIPYSNKYTKKLLGEGKGRRIIQSDPRELIWPIGSFEKHIYISSRIGKRNLAKFSMHQGVDIACDKGTPIIAANDGVVERSGNHASYGLSVVIQHKVNNLKTLYAHASSLLVKEGEFVKKGQIIALVGNTGHSTGHHLHFEVRYQDIVLNPEHYFTPPGSEYDEKVVMHETVID